MNFDLLVIGEGLAALTLLLHLPKNIKVGVISLNQKNESASYLAQGGISAVFSLEDSIEKHLEDTLKAGDGLCNEAVVRDIVGAGSTTLNWLIEMGVPFTKENGKIHLTREGGHSNRRVAHVDDMTGRSIMQTLQEKIAPLSHVTWIRGHEAVDLISDEGRVTGVVTRNIEHNQITIFNAANIVLAAGGITGLYPYATNPYASKGEAIAMAWRAGANIENLEFIQFHPTAFAFNNKVVSLITEAVRGEGGYLYNVKNERFMPRYSSQEELAPRDIVARAIYSEMALHQSSHVWLDITHKDRYFIEQHFPNLVKLTRQYGFDLSTTRVPVSPAAHYTCGGIAAKISGQTNVKGLFAIGEVANTGLHGANRLASNSLLECVVMGKACAEVIANTQVHCHAKTSIPRALKTNLSMEMLPMIKSILWNSAGIVRTQQGIQSGLQQLSELQANPVNVLPHGQALSLRNRYDAAYLILKSASLRKESRGGHFNLDYPDKLTLSDTIINGIKNEYSELLQLTS